MSALPHAAPVWLDSRERLKLGREILRAEAQTLLQLADRLGMEFLQACELVCGCDGAVLVTGMGKAGLIGQKIAATLASTGTRAHYLHPAEAVHGDLGRVDSRDLVLALSYRGETEEVNRLLPSFAAAGARVLAVTGRPQSTLGRGAHLILDLGPVQEACPLGLAPSSSTTAMLALGDALALVVSRMKQFSHADFARFHPGGSLGRKLRRVEEAMRPLVECRVARDTLTVREVLVSQSRPGRRTGAIMLVDEQGILTGLFTDSDLARLLEHKRDAELDGPAAAVMTHNPLTTRASVLLEAACEQLAERKISELPVVDEDRRPVGLLDITDVMALDQAEKPASAVVPLRVVSPT